MKIFGHYAYWTTFQRPEWLARHASGRGMINELVITNY